MGLIPHRLVVFELGWGAKKTSTVPSVVASEAARRKRSHCGLGEPLRCRGSRASALRGFPRQCVAEVPSVVATAAALKQLAFG